MDTKTSAAAEEIRMSAFRGALHMDRIDRDEQPDTPWYWTVDPDDLDMDDCDACVLGQYTGHYRNEEADDIVIRADRAYDRLTNARRFGFTEDPELIDAYEEEDGGAAVWYLTECWQHEIRERRLADPAE